MVSPAMQSSLAMQRWLAGRAVRRTGMTEVTGMAAKADARG